jgi:hypothetical protein
MEITPPSATSLSERIDSLISCFQSTYCIHLTTRVVPTTIILTDQVCHTIIHHLRRLLPGIGSDHCHRPFSLESAVSPFASAENGNFPSTDQRWTNEVDISRAGKRCVELVRTWSDSVTSPLHSWWLKKTEICTVINRPSLISWPVPAGHGLTVSIIHLHIKWHHTMHSRSPYGAYPGWSPPPTVHTSSYFDKIWMWTIITRISKGW